ncbi:MAG: hypothetical protein UU48_C0040G0004 [Candidatus Uhrbacteria bacterium GW2011_GWF2_41_16]|uniref:Uncharacterized protein n=1 Tax=Candidatus Uhrbacteria bacterium GW2011_GWF2_41_16 TaxID=1618997 RepID=A0A0G0XGI6_9BACT|nr:MAG: hypothetical protein UU48_C0040G0004 [Candidatus Uhrbacteria bacterium GW2011_GWF2_41_16]
MYVTDPSVSTAGSFLTRTLCLTIFIAPRDRDMVTTAGRASGIAATARLTAVRNISTGDSPLMIPTTNTMAHMARADMPSHCPTLIRRF